MPKLLEEFKAQFPEVWESYEHMRNVCDRNGPLDSKTAELIKIGVSTALEHEGGLIAHISHARKAGAKDEEIYHAILISMSLVGFPAALAAFQTARQYLRR